MKLHEGQTAVRRTKGPKLTALGLSTALVAVSRHAQLRQGIKVLRLSGETCQPKMRLGWLTLALSTDGSSRSLLAIWGGELVAPKDFCDARSLTQLDTYGI